MSDSDQANARRVISLVKKMQKRAGRRNHNFDLLRGAGALAAPHANRPEFQRELARQAREAWPGDERTVAMVLGLGRHGVPKKR
jgi:hypothetical protein